MKELMDSLKSENNLEKLSKVQKITSIIGQIDNYMIPLILNLTDSS